MDNLVHAADTAATLEIGSGVGLKSVGETTRLSEYLWGRDWLDHLPMKIANSTLIADRCSVEGAIGFIREHFPELTEETGTGVRSSPSVREAKARYIALSDAFEVREAGNTVGIFVGAPEDWSTYYCRVIAVLPKSRRPNLLRRVAEQVIFPRLKSVGVERFEAETSPVNIAMTRFFLEAGFCVTGQRITERWGVLVRYAKFLRSAELESFADRFSGVAPRVMGQRHLSQAKETGR